MPLGKVFYVPTNHIEQRFRDNTGKPPCTIYSTGNKVAPGERKYVIRLPMQEIQYRDTSTFFDNLLHRLKEHIGEHSSVKRVADGVIGEISLVQQVIRENMSEVCPIEQEGVDKLLALLEKGDKHFKQLKQLQMDLLAN